jgi:hypothetical protein
MATAVPEGIGSYRAVEVVGLNVEWGNGLFREGAAGETAHIAEAGRCQEQKVEAEAEPRGEDTEGR